jgi:outer membrane protein assembly factor BamA
MRSLLALVLVAALAGTMGVLLIKHLPEVALGEAEASVGPSAPRRPHAPEIESVSFEGKDLPFAALRAALTSRAGGKLDQATLDHDRDALRAALTARGYLAAEVAPAVVDLDQAGGAYVTFAITPGPRFHVRSVEVPGIASRDLTGLVTLTAGDDALPARIERTRQAIVEYLARHGKPAALATHLALDPATASVDVVLAAS